MTATLVPHIPGEVADLAPFVDAGVLGVEEVQAAAVVARLVPGSPFEVLLATAMCVRSLGAGHVCLVLHEADRIEVDEVRPGDGRGTAASGRHRPEGGTAGSDGGEGLLEGLPWPDPAAWAAVLASSDAVVQRDPDTGEPTAPTDPTVTRPLVFDGTRVYLERYWRYERQVGDRLLSAGATATDQPDAELEALLDRFFPPQGSGEVDLQRRAASVALRRKVTVLAGGPGTGKTHTVARFLAAAHTRAASAQLPLSVALAAPTGKAATRMAEAVARAVEELDLDEEVADAMQAVASSTLHRLLGYRPGRGYRHDSATPLPHDVVVVDETSMVDLPLMARLLDALRPDARLVLVGDPFQLASVEAGAVLGDVVGPAARDSTAEGPISESVLVLQRVRRFEEGSAIARLASAVRDGDAAAALSVLHDPDAPEVSIVHPDDASALDAVRRTVTLHSAEVVGAALEGDATAALGASLELKVLCATRWGPTGSVAWREQIERRLPGQVPGLRTDLTWYAGRPVIVTRNDYLTGVFNGDTGITVERDGRKVVVVDSANGPTELSPAMLGHLETWWAMTVHKSQGSEFDHVVLSLPTARSRILTNELVYTGITRGRQRVTVVASDEAFRSAVERPIRRASGLQARLWG